MARRTLLLLLKPFDVYPVAQSDCLSRITNPQILHYLENRRKVHKDAINFCQNILRQKPVEWKPTVRSNLSEPIRDVDLVVTVGGDGTLLQGSHFIDDSVPVLGVNSDPTQPEEVLDNILESQANPSKLTRISIRVNSEVLPTYALNDIFNFTSMSGSTFAIVIQVHSRSSGLRVSTAAGSTAAMLSAGGFLMPILSQDLQYMDGDAIEISSNAPILKVFLPHHLHNISEET
ncbi:hypothetical protein C1H46_037486 [Malus baccata]|uniref:NADH kinase n=1 Tax=Malus baccata TaxID=106549 RepID=A0A540KRY1_MALBA|nr:hypothetical protein C1H46_037486 [Malus baccata]